jgi:hypothetical protein
VPDPLALEQGAARLDAVAGRLSAALDGVTIGPTDWTGTAAERFHDDLAARRDELARVAATLRQQAAAARAAAARPILPS